MTVKFIIAFSDKRQIRIQRWYIPLNIEERRKIVNQIMTLVLQQRRDSCNYHNYQNWRIVTRRYASLHFAVATTLGDNELYTSALLHQIVVYFNDYFHNVRETDITFNFDKATYIIDEFLIGGEINEVSSKKIKRSVLTQDAMQEASEPRYLATLWDDLNIKEIFKDT